MRESAAVEVCTQYMHTSDVLGLIDLKSLTLSGKKRALVVGVPVENASAMSELIVHASECIGLPERESKALRKGLERRPDRHRCDLVPLKPATIKNDEN